MYLWLAHAALHKLATPPSCISPNVCPVNAHAKGNRGHHNLQPSLTPVALHLSPLLAILSSMVLQAVIDMQGRALQVGMCRHSYAEACCSWC
jgi:hypothetical protein